MSKEYIEREAAIEILNIAYPLGMDEAAYDTMHSMISKLPAADVRPVVLCRDCINYVESKEANGEKMCVRDADWSVEDGCYYGFTEYPKPDWFCADGKKREGNHDNG